MICRYHYISVFYQADARKKAEDELRRNTELAALEEMRLKLLMGDEQSRIIEGLSSLFS